MWRYSNPSRRKRFSLSCFSTYDTTLSVRFPGYVHLPFIPHLVVEGHHPETRIQIVHLYPLLLLSRKSLGLFQYMKLTFYYPSPSSKDDTWKLWLNGKIIVLPANLKTRTNFSIIQLSLGTSHCFNSNDYVDRISLQNKEFQIHRHVFKRKWRKFFQFHCRTIGILGQFLYRSLTEPASEIGLCPNLITVN